MQIVSIVLAYLMLTAGSAGFGCLLSGKLLRGAALLGTAVGCIYLLVTTLHT